MRPRDFVIEYILRILKKERERDIKTPLIGSPIEKWNICKTYIEEAKYWLG